MLLQVASGLLRIDLLSKRSVANIVASCYAAGHQKKHKKCDNKKNGAHATQFPNLRYRT
jgi:hypothetical protein